MKTTRIARLAAIGLACTALASAVSAQSAEPLALAPFTGDAGYQEVQLEGDAWYLAFHGTRKHAIRQVQAGWWARAAQLCETARKPLIVELRYVGEPVYDDEPVARYDDEFTVVHVAGPVFIPMFIPSGPRNIPPTLTPTKASVVRCIERSTGLRAGRKAVTLAEAKEEARQASVSLP